MGSQASGMLAKNRNMGRTQRLAFPSPGQSVAVTRCRWVEIVSPPSDSLSGLDSIHLLSSSCTAHSLDLYTDLNYLDIVGCIPFCPNF